MDKDYTVYFVIAAMIFIIAIATVIAKVSPPEHAETQTDLNDTAQNDSVDTEPQMSMLFKESAKGVDVTIEAASQSSAKVKVGEESAWIDEGKSHTFSSGAYIYVKKIHRTGPQNTDFSVELYVS